MKGRQRFALVESGDMALLLPWLTAFTRVRDSRQRDTAQGASEEKLERASSACRHAGEVKVAARTLLAEPRSPGNEDTWDVTGGQVPLRRPRRRIRGGGGGRAGECHRG